MHALPGWQTHQLVTILGLQVIREMCCFASNKCNTRASSWTGAGLWATGIDIR